MRGRSSTGPAEVARLRQILSVVDDAVAATDLAGRITEWNQAASRLYGWTAAEVIGEPLHEVLSVELGPTDLALIAGCALMGQVWSGRVRARQRDGSPIVVRVDQLALPDPTDRVDGAVTVSALLAGPGPDADSVPSDWLAVVRLDGGVPYLSSGMYAALGLPVGLDLLMLTIVHPEDREIVRQVLRARGADPTGITVRLRGADRQYQGFRFVVNDLTRAEPGALLLTGHPVDDGVAAAPDRARLDVIEQRAQERLRALEVLTDTLTGLPNGVLLVERLQGLLDGLGDEPHAAAVLYLDVDDFTRVNEELGTQAGDELLVILGRRLRRALRAEETVGRFGNDEFVVCAQVDDEDGAAAIAGRLARVLSERTVVQGHELHPTVSIGIAITRDPHRTPDSLLREADTAMHGAQDGGQAQVAVFDRERRQLAG